ncbi:MAG: hypothetical protein IPM58_16405 [Nitrospira sp.]|nr:hypothetical protein [Nitrospira sp.]
MLKVTGQRDAVSQGISLVIEGRLAGAWVEELNAYCRALSENQQHCTKIVLAGVTFIDADGRALLARLWREGAQLRASGCLTRRVVEEITGESLVDQFCRNQKNVVSETDHETG